MELKTYSNASNARRAAKAAGIDTALVYRALDVSFKIRVAPEPAPAPQSFTAAAMKALTGVDETGPVKAAKPAKAKRVAKAPAPEKVAASKAPAPGAKTAQLIKMITKGATASELQKALGWLPHTCRGALSRLGSAGYAVTRTKVGTDDGFESHYKIAS